MRIVIIAVNVLTPRRRISAFCPHSVSMCFVWIWEQTAVILLYSVKWLGFMSSLRGTNWNNCSSGYWKHGIKHLFHILINL